MAHKLVLNDTLAPAVIFGIISDLPDYRLCYIINNELGLRLCRCHKDKVLYFKQQKLQYSEFSYHEPVPMITWRLTSNSSASFYPTEGSWAEKASVPLVKDLGSINYFLWYEDENNEALNKCIITRLRSNKHIRAIQQIDQSTSKGIGNLLFEY